ncbi:PQQ-dependent sugar dehydrogenase [Aliiglaciecola sp. M165]|uniref:PQQ-dependent sugar dehydrogenase n=1 Tax=Aliiglaciecola sp. M165 TaxID=2593649 RepID=UPI00117FB02E|nr:PQQ-dependent sugar dehydrogenase [Aliiglaciecola sp. M165]TRY31420.1 sorbosone dehydrogenase family protein [Aliiglaciecola sp. M165]
MKKLALLTLGLAALTFTSSSLGLALDKLSLPDGFSISVYAENVKNARQMAIGKTGIVYVGSRGEGKVHAVVDENKDGIAEKVVLIAEGLTMPSGLTYKDGDLYVSEVSQILKYENIDSTYTKSPQGKVVVDGLPSEKHHGWKNIDFGPDGWLYVPVGAPCNICETVNDGKFDDPMFSSILKVDLSSGEKQWVAKGVRNSVGFDWHPQTKELWFSDNGRDWMGDDIPPCEINRVSKEGQHFGYPYFHGGTIADPEFGEGKKASDYVHPELNLGAHVAPLGIHFYQGSQFPAEYKKTLFVAEHGSWNRSSKVGYRVMMAMVENNKITDYRPFIDGFLNSDDTAWGRPVAMLTLPDGSLLVSDDFADAIYKVTYSK